MMQLEHLIHPVKEMVFSSKGTLSDGKLAIQKDDLAALLDDDPSVRLIGIEIARPGHSVRIAPVLDIVEPRVKQGPSQTEHGKGKTHILRGAAVMGVCELPGIQEGLVDMSQAAGWFSPFSGTHNLVLVFEVRNEAGRVDADHAIRQNLFKAAEYLGSLATTCEPDQSVRFTWPLPQNDKAGTGLVYLVQSQGDLRRTYLKGQAMDEVMPLSLNPLEALDNAVTSGNFVMPSNKTCTYIHQNNPLVYEMIKQHGRSIHFSGVILANEMSRLEDKEKVAQKIVHIAKDMDLSGVVINQEGGANTLTDVMMICRRLEREGIKTVLILNEFAGEDGKTPSLAETTAEAEHIVSTGNNDFRITLPAAETIIGSDRFPGVENSLKETASLPLSRVHSSTNQLGFGYLSCSADGAGNQGSVSKKEGPFRVVHYLNQFFGQIGGEDKADAELQVREGPVGPGMAFKMLFGQKAEIVATIICGDNTMGTNLDEISASVAELAGHYSPDLFIAGPCFLAGRYGMACGAAGKAVGEKLSIPTVVGIAESNPGVDVYRNDTYMVPCGESAAKMKQAAEAMVELALCLSKGRSPETGSYLTRNIRHSITRTENGAMRAVSMLAAKMKGLEPKTELPLPRFDRVDPAPPLANLSDSTVILCTEGGLTPKDNPDRIEMSMATRFGKYPIGDLQRLDPDQYTVAHGGYDNAAAQEDPNRLLPLDALRDLEDAGIVGKVGNYFYTTAGNATSVENSEKFGREIAEDIRRQFKQKVGVVFTST